MNYNAKNNIIGIFCALGLFIISIGIFMIFVNSDAATSSDIDTSNAKSAKTNETIYYTVNDGKIEKNNSKVNSNVTVNFANIKVYGMLNDDMGVLDFSMEKANVRAKYRNVADEENNKEYFSFNEKTLDTSKRYRVEGDIGQDEMFQGYVYYNNDEEKELCSHLRSNSYFEMVMCEDEKYLYTTMNTANLKDSNSDASIKNNALYKFNKKTHETSRICDINIHNDGVYIEGIACNDEFLYLLTKKDEELIVRTYSKTNGSKKSETSVHSNVDIDSFVQQQVAAYDIREVTDYEILDQGYECHASKDGLVIMRKLIAAEIDKASNKHYGEKGYSSSFENKGLEPFVGEYYLISCYNVSDKEVSFDSIYLCETPYMFDLMYYKEGILYILSNEENVNSNLVEKIRVTAVSKGNLLDQIYINLNKVSDTTGRKELKYIGVE